MDPITHFMFGGCLGRAGFNRKSALATVTMVLAAEAPDIDVVTEFGGDVYAFSHHRGITHTLIGVPLIAALVVFVVWAGWRLRQYFKRRRSQRSTSLSTASIAAATAGAQTTADPVSSRASSKDVLSTGSGNSSAYQHDNCSRNPRWGLLYAFACLAALSHILLDFTNSYGVRPFMPFYGRWFSWDIVYIVDPVLWAILLGGLLLPALFRLIDREIGVRDRQPRGRIGALLALVLIATFWGVRDYEHRRAIAAMESLTYRGQDALRVSAYPYLVNPFRWYGVIETATFFERTEVNSRTPEVDPDDRAEIRPKPEQTPAVVAAKNSYLGRVYLNWAQYPVTEEEKLQPPQSGYVVRFYDLRYMYPGEKRTFLSGRVRLDDKYEVVAESFGGRPRHD